MTKQLPYHCPIDAAMHVIEGKWKVLVLWEVGTGRAVRGTAPGASGISEKVLAQQLRELETDGIVHREVHDTVPPKVEYTLTDEGRELNAALEPLGAWGQRRMRAPGSAEAA
ncbi:helix-turn-helix domain-containing protein [Streptomyces thioluteus]|uniref:Helix-turn-helix domain-containing protein n=1 Tax=Streptomyces thioluteus TaxID=66431 RepID=A0ABN3WQ62_STRTU